ncbi:MAG: Stress response protein [Frankiales bacterium]|nr:Stress response protein [Frankiales bacterium]
MTTTLSKGANAPLGTARVLVTLSWQGRSGVDADCSALLLAAATGKVRSDADFVFYNQPTGAGGAVAHAGKTSGTTTTDSVRVDTSRLPADVDRVVVAASADGGTFGQLGALSVTVAEDGGAPLVRYDIADASTETALVFVELYLRGGAWKVRAVGQGYDTGLAGLATDFGVTVDDEPAPSPTTPATTSPATTTPDTTPPARGLAGPAPVPSRGLTPPRAPAATPAPTPAAPVSLEKRRLVDLEKKLSTQAPAMLSLVKTAGVSLTKRGLGEHTARVALCLDISASMAGLYRRGAVQRLAERVLALALRFDDDGAVDVFLFGREGYTAPAMTLENSPTFLDRALRAYPLEGATFYGKAVRLVREHYFGDAVARREPLREQLPVYVMFLTDGEPNDRKDAEAQVREAALEPVFWQFMGIGKRFPFLEKLDDLRGRYVDNADFFSVTEDELLGRSPLPDDALFDRLMQEYPAWLPQARQKGLLA